MGSSLLPPGWQMRWAAHPGEPGLRRTPSGQIAFPLGARPETLASPLVMPRGKWHAQWAASGRAQPSTHPTLAIGHCAFCTARIAADLAESELYLAPFLGARRRRGGRSQPCLEWKTLCGTCARHELQLGHGFCLVGLTDWEDTESRLTSGIAPAVRQAKVAELELALIPAWNAVQRAGRAQQGFSFDRAWAFARFLAAVEPPDHTYGPLAAELAAEAAATERSA